MMTPPQPIPEPLRGAEIGTFAHYTVTVRMPRIARQALEAVRAQGERLPPESSTRLEGLLDEIPDALLAPVDDPSAADSAAWNRSLEPYRGQNWLEAPWFLIETYFYRRIVAATGYFQAGDGRGFDPYGAQKKEGLQAAGPGIQALGCRVEAGLADIGKAFQHLAGLLAAGVWGNQADLSMWPAGGEAPGQDDLRANLLTDDTHAALAHLEKIPTAERRVDLILDNTGLELVSDLALADLLLSGGGAGEVRFHVKSHPTFVSDVTAADVFHTLSRLAGSPAAVERGMALRLIAHLQAGRMRLRDHFFWTSPLPLWELPPELRQELAAASLLVVKGDANYRRCLGDRHWQFTTPFNEILRYAPAPLLALRVLKSEIVSGLQTGQAERVAQTDPEWMTNGKWGLIQFAGAPAAHA